MTPLALRRVLEWASQPLFIDQAESDPYSDEKS
jgi:hypothetical protein